MASMGMVIKSVLLCSLALLATLLQGCGCTAENISKCGTDNTTPTDMNGFCKYIEDYTKCFKDNGCCSNADAKTVMDAWKMYEAAPYSCTIPSC